MSLPIFQSAIRELQMLQTQWTSQLNPLLANPTTNPQILKGIVLASGANVINTKLGTKAQGWYITDINAAVTVYRSAPFNDLTLTLTASGAATIDLVIF